MSLSVSIRVHPWFGRSIQSARRFIRDDAQAVAAFAAKSVHQTTSLFMRQTAGFAAAFADHRPPFKFQLAHHRQ